MDYILLETNQCHNCRDFFHRVTRTTTNTVMLSDTDPTWCCGYHSKSGKFKGFAAEKL